MEWISDWSKIHDDKKYVVCPINQRSNIGFYYLGQPSGIQLGWQVKRLLPKCYVALLMPEFKPEDHGLKQGGGDACLVEKET